MNAQQLRLYVVRPALSRIAMWSRDAEELVLATAAKESGFVYVRQLGGGPALGLWQMEPATAEDIWRNYIEARPALAVTVRALLAAGVDRTEQLIWNLAYAAAMCRIHYRRFREPLPSERDVTGMARYYKKYYNTVHGKATVEEFVASHQRLIARPSVGGEALRPPTGGRGPS